MVRRKISRRTPAYLKISLWAVFIGIIIALFVFLRLYKAAFSPNVNNTDGNAKLFYISSGSAYDDIITKLEAQNLIKDSKTFEWLAQKKNYPNHIHPGRYRIPAGISNNDLLNMLRSGRQETILIKFNNLRTLTELSEKIAKKLEPSAKAFNDYLCADKTAVSMGFNAQTFPAMFIPNSYEFYWNTSPEEFVKRMKREYIAFWSKGRKKKADALNLSEVEVISLASIVDQESLYDDENPLIAGVFINRLEKGIPLQSDPTIIFAWKDFSIRRVLNKYKKIDSPYNTYKHKGLPPGPISIASISSIDGVLNYKKHNYYYFCAKPDFSGYHSFARTLSQHNKNARLYQQALNRRKIYK